MTSDEERRATYRRPGSSEREEKSRSRVGEREEAEEEEMEEREMSWARAGEGRPSWPRAGATTGEDGWEAIRPAGRGWKADQSVSAREARG
ncbi:MAG: hypothetical protein GY714_23250 [Desulfobacterales bacterium]|nr:hypothetical protein [Desulfobacterales bacterium]